MGEAETGKGRRPVNDEGHSRKWGRHFGERHTRELTEEFVILSTLVENCKIGISLETLSFLTTS
jgi:hypothetical protein